MMEASCFNDRLEEEISKLTLPDLLKPHLDIVIIGTNPGLTSALKGHHYSGPTNHFWSCLNSSGLTPKVMTANDDSMLLQHGIGFTNVVERASKSSGDLNRDEIKHGCNLLLEKLKKFQPKIAVFNGKFIYEVFSGTKDFNYGAQPERIEGIRTYAWVMPSSSARSSCVPSISDKLPFYKSLKKFRDYLNGSVVLLNEDELTFPGTDKIISLNLIKGDVKSEFLFVSKEFNETDYEEIRLQNEKDEKEFKRNLAVLRVISNKRD